MSEVYAQSPLFTTEKRCIKCGEVRPLDDYRLTRSGNRRSKCKVCIREERMVDYYANHEQHKAVSVAYQREHRAERAEYDAMRWRKDLEASRAKRRATYQRNKEKISQQRRVNRQQRSEHYLAQQRVYKRLHAEEVRERDKKWKREHPERSVVDVAKRKARKLGASRHDFTVAQWEELRIYFNGYCAYCNQPMEKPTQEHMQPLSRGGDHTLDNIVPSCRRCNSRKYNRTLAEFLLLQSWYDLKECG